MKPSILKRLEWIGGVALATILATGCSSESKRRNLPEEVVAPKPPAFIVGPAAVLLTNATPFNARLTVEWVGETNRFHIQTGQLLGQGSHLLFSLERNDRTFIWDTGARSGYVLSESLQGYAPLSSPIQVTNLAIVSEVAGPSSDRVNGHPGHEVEISLASNDGTAARFSIWRASDLKGQPVRIKSLTAAKPFIINLLDIRPATLGASLFSPPDGFSKYANPDIMAGELMMRRSKPKSSEPLPNLDDIQRTPRSNYSH